MKCPICNNVVSEKVKFCPECGSAIECQGKTCPNPKCGRTGLPQDAIFCPDCRSKLLDDNDISIENESSNIQISEVDNSTYAKLSVNKNPTHTKGKDSTLFNIVGGIIFIAIIIGIIVALNSIDSDSAIATDPSETTEEVVAEDIAPADTAIEYVENTSSYLNVSNDNVNVNSEGGSFDISIDTDGEWEISTGTASWGHITCNGNSLSLTIDENSNNSSRTDYFIVKAGNIEKRINITQNANTKPSAHIENIWMEFNVMVNGSKGMYIHTKFSINNQRGKNVYVYALFYHADNTTVLHDPYGNDLYVYGYVTPSYDNAICNDLVLFMPYVSLNMPVGWSGSLSFDICIKDASGEQLVRKNNTQFSFTMGS